LANTSKWVCFIVFWNNGATSIQVETYSENYEDNLKDFRILSDEEVESYREKLLSIGMVFLIAGECTEINLSGGRHIRQVEFDIDENFDYVQQVP
jgi:hypothetical protein